MTDEIVLLTEDSESVVDSDDHDVAVTGEDGAVVEIAAAPVEAVPVYKKYHWQRGAVCLTWKCF